MSDVVISAEGLSKRYRLGLKSRPRTFGESVVNGLTAPFRRLKSRGETDTGDFWALKDACFEVRRGEVVGIIGRNGAGKSTLLKVLSHITPPTCGQVKLHGRVASLLEVGTGFHPELTGRENIYLNGAILGMRRREISRRFDEIVEFSEVEAFLDTPVKRYSSGMYVRLAFAVAAHLEPEILIVDEVLAVGDAEFQKKCIGKMQEVASGTGRTVLFVSHNLAAVAALCNRGLLLKDGTVGFAGDIDQTLSQYRQMVARREFHSRVTTRELQWRGLMNQETLGDQSCNENIVLDLGFRTGEVDLRGLEVDVALVDAQDRIAVHCRSTHHAEALTVPGNADFVVRISIQSPFLAPGDYRLTVYASAGGRELCWIEEIEALKISLISPFSRGGLLNGIRSAIVPAARYDLQIVKERNEISD